MKKYRWLWGTMVFWLAASSLCSSGCKEDEKETGDPTVDSGLKDGGSDTDSDTDTGLPDPVVCEDTIASIYEDPGELPENKGAVIRCAVDEALSKEAIQAFLDAEPYKGKPATSGAEVFRILYRTERGNGAPGYGAAAVYVPDNPRADKLPMIVVSHGSRGQAPQCAPSMVHPDAEYINDDQQRMIYTMVGFGFPVIAPDLAGYANYGAQGNPPSAYASAPDVGRSTLDSARALRQVIPGMLNDKIVLTGHSQGGHSALASLALSESYGAGGTIAAVVTFSALWFSQATWGAFFMLADDYPLEKSPTQNAVSIWYNYTQAELFDGPGEGVKLFKENVREGIKTFVDTRCWGPPYEELNKLGTTAKDLFTDEFMNAVKGPAAFGGSCAADDPPDSLCNRWTPRYLGDRPHIEGAAAQIPNLVIYGGKDDVIDPGRFQCVLERLKKDNINLSYCYDPEGTHGEMPSQLGDYAADWVAHQTMGTPLEATCPSYEINLVDAENNPIKCTVPPPNI